MKLSVDENNLIKIEEVFNSLLFETKDGEKILLCMRDSGFEIGVKDSSVKLTESEKGEYYDWYSIKGGVVERIANVACVKNITKNTTKN